MENLYKKSAIEVYLDNVRNKIPNIKESDLEMIKYAFEAGFNVGCCNNAPEILQEAALVMLSK